MTYSVYLKISVCSFECIFIVGLIHLCDSLREEKNLIKVDPSRCRLEKDEWRSAKKSRKKLNFKIGNKNDSQGLKCWNCNPESSFIIFLYLLENEKRVKVNYESNYWSGPKFHNLNLIGNKRTNSFFHKVPQRFIQCISQMWTTIPFFNQDLQCLKIQKISYEATQYILK